MTELGEQHILMGIMIFSGILILFQPTAIQSPSGQLALQCESQLHNPETLCPGDSICNCDAGTPADKSDDYSEYPKADGSCPGGCTSGSVPADDPVTPDNEVCEAVKQLLNNKKAECPTGCDETGTSFVSDIDGACCIGYKYTHCIVPPPPGGGIDIIDRDPETSTIDVAPLEPQHHASHLSLETDDPLCPCVDGQSTSVSVGFQYCDCGILGGVQRLKDGGCKSYCDKETVDSQDAACDTAWELVKGSDPPDCPAIACYFLKIKKETNPQGTQSCQVTLQSDCRRNFPEGEIGSGVDIPQPVLEL